MNSLKKDFKTLFRDRIFLMAFLVSGGTWLYFFRAKINPDGVSYMAAAEALARGNFWGSVTSYWAPLYSWLMSPLIALGVKSIYAAKLAALPFCATAVTIIYAILRKLGVEAKNRCWAAILLLPLLFHSAFYEMTPDFIGLSFILFYLYLTIHDDFFSDRKALLIAGTSAGLGFLAKNYNLAFFATHFLAILLLECFKNRRAVLLAPYFFIPFGVIGAFWVVLVKMKYGIWTIGTAGLMNNALFSPRTLGHPLHTMGFRAPFPPYGYSAWDDPTPLLELVKSANWKVFESKETLNYLLQRMKENFRGILNVFNDFSILFFPIFIAVIPSAFKRKALAKILLAAIIYTVGFLPFLPDHRYLYPPLFAVIVLLLAQRFKFSLLAVLLVTFLYFPVMNLKNSRNNGAYFMQAAEQLRDDAGIKPGSSLAANSSWYFGLNTAFHLKAHFFGEPKPDESPQDVVSGLQKLPIDYYFFYGEPKGDQYGLLKSKFPVVKHPLGANLTIFKLR